MLLSIRKNLRFVVVSLLFIFLQTYSVEVYALTSGPGQQEYASFEPVGTTDMVNLYSGDFTYNIPLLSIPGPNGGYPINLAYHSGIGMDQEASWVGLGWNVNVGAINRSLRGLPDDFDGDEVQHEQHMRKSTTMGLNLFQNSEEFLGISQGSSSPTLQIYHNNYKGLGYRVSHHIGHSASVISSGLTLSYDPHEGIGVGLNLGVGAGFAEAGAVSLGVSGNWNSRQGLQAITVSGSVGIQGPVDNELYNVGLSTSATFGFHQGVPSVTMPMHNTHYTTELKMGFGREALPGPGIFKSKFPLNWTGTYAASQVRGNGITTSKAYGYMNTEHATDEDALKDFSYTPIAYHRKLPNLSPSNVTYDVFGITGQGTGGGFRGHRADVGIFSQRATKNLTEQYRLAIDLGFASASNSPNCPISYYVGFGGIPPTIGIAEDYSGAWQSGYGIANALKSFKTPSGHTYDKEVKFYKDIGDRPAILGNTSMYDAWKGDKAVKLEIVNKSIPAINVEGITENVDLAHASTNNVAERLERTPRTRVIQSLTKEQAGNYGMSKAYKFIDPNHDPASKFTSMAAAHHTSEISILETDGMRYIYGLPAYNHTQEDASFSVKKAAPNASTQMPNPTTPTPGGSGYYPAPSETSKHPEFLDKKTLPAYAHAWMLTSVVSADYVDVTGDGVSEDDLGYWVDFKYQKTSDAYHWRAPYEDAIYMAGTNQDFDDKGSYSKGTKELFYLKEVRTKTHVAIYNLADRDDALEAASTPNGGRPSPVSTAERMKKLQSIKLYTIDEYNKGLQTQGYTAEPLKTVHFVYAAETDALCKKVPNHTVTNGGKLTLEAVYFTYGKSNKGQLSPYQFTYSSHNPDYALQHHDCWGNYQKNDLKHYPYHEFPYTDQQPDEAYQAPWHLTSIALPTGGTLNIEYEQDDYAYIEDQKAMQLYDIAFAGRHSDFNSLSTAALSKRETAANHAHTGSLKNDQYDNTGDVFSPNYQYRLYFPLKTAVTGTNISELHQWLGTHYIGETSDLYFKTAVKLLEEDQGNPVNRDNEAVDFVSGYAVLKKDVAGTDYGVAQSPSTRGTNQYDMGYITVKPSVITSFAGSSDLIHPIRNAAFQHLKQMRSELVFGPRNPADFAGLFNFIPDILTTMMGYKAAFKQQHHCSEMYLDGFSQMRLLVPDGKKLGGGVRVRQLTLKDNWDEMAGAGYQNSTYGQVYEYTIKADDSDELISSGVAYEPYAGKEQNPLVTPQRYVHSNFGQTRSQTFLENPIMMRHYPGASVGYRQVTVKSLTSKTEDSKESRAPFTVYEFYSPKDFPIQVHQTDPDRVGPKYKIIPIPGIYTEQRRYEGMSQGYTIIFNDMAGKMKTVTQRTYEDESDNYGSIVISSQFYEYYKQEDGNLLNEVDVFVADGVYEKAKLGIDYDIHVDMNENLQSSDNFTLDLNLMSSFLPYCIPLPVPASGGISSTSSSLKTATIQKFVYKSGILKSTRVTNQNSTITTENLVFDKMTGEPLLTRTQNEFHDDIYAYNQKAYWAYDGMAEAFKNTGAVLEGPYTYNTPTGNDIGTFTINGMGSLSAYPLVEGDEVYLENDAASLGIKATVFTVENTGSSSSRRVSFSKHKGILVDNNDISSIDRITIIRSGRRNLLRAPAGAIAAMNLNYVPNTTIGDSRTLTIDETSEILNATAATYRDYWPTHKGCKVEQTCVETICLPFDSDKNANETAFLTALDNGTATMTLDGAPLPAEAIVINGNCTPPTRTMNFCTGTIDPDYIVRYRLSNGNFYHPDPTYRTVQGNCGTVNMGEFTLPCAPEQSDVQLRRPPHAGGPTHQITVNGTPWPLANIKTVERCEYGYAEWLLNSLDPNYGSNAYVDFKCFSNTGGVDDIQYSYQYFGPMPNTTNWNTHHAWAPINSAAPASPSHQNFFDRLTDVTGVIYPWSNRALHARAYLPILIANDIRHHGKLGLRAYWRNNGQFCGSCFPWGSTPIPEDLQMTYRLVYDPVMFHGYVIRNLAPGTYSFAYQKIGGRVISSYDNQVITAQPVPILATAVDLPINTNGAVMIFDSDSTFVDSTTVSQVLPAPYGLSINLNNIPLGNHLLTIDYDHDGDASTPNVSRDFTLSCTAEEANSNTLLCADGSKLDVGADLYNAYQTGTKGRWRPWASYTYVGKRYYGDGANPNPSIRKKGIFTTFTPFNWANTTNGDSWQWATRGTKYTSDGYEVETVNALGHYSAALYDYQDNLATAVAKNARYNEILFDGFENYPKACNTHVYLADGAQVVTTQHHTGEHSYAIAANSTTSFEPILVGGSHEEACAEQLGELGYDEADVLAFLKEGKEAPNMNIPKILRTATAINDGALARPLPIECSCLGRFAPEKGKQYYLSAWLKRDLPVHNVIYYNNLTVRVSFNDAAGNPVAGTTLLYPEGNMVEQWQQIKGAVDIPDDAVSMTLSVVNGQEKAFLDDLRISPFESSMATYVYDKATLRNTATLDDNNFATFYIYDEEGKLVKTKKETPEGIKTINEGRQHIRGPFTQ